MKHLLLAALLLATTALPAAELVGVQMPDTWRVGEETLVLNGIGVREYGFLKVDVYVAALYLRERQKVEQAVLDAPGPKVINMQFFHDVSREDTLKVWDWSLAQNCTASCVLPVADIAAFKALVPTTRAGDVQTYVFHSDGVELRANGRSLGKVPGAVFSRLLLATWVGAVPPTQDLKKSLLGASR